MVQAVYDVDALLSAFRVRDNVERGRLVELTGLQGRDGYNPSGPVQDGGYPLIYVRVERRDIESDSWAVPFRQVAVDCWELDPALPAYQLEDLFVTTIHGVLLVAGVRITTRTAHSVEWETVFLKGSDLATLQEFARSPAFMKDVRLIELQDGTIGVFTRPWDSRAGRARIGYTEIGSLDELTTSVMAHAPLIETQPLHGQWWGANALYDLGNGQIGVLGHIARSDGGNLSYYPITFVLDREDRSVIHGPWILAERSCFPSYPAKRPDLLNVMFPSWVDRERGLLFSGLSDSAIGVISVGDPFAPNGI